MNVSRAVADLENCTWGRNDLFKHLFFPPQAYKAFLVLLNFGHDDIDCIM